MRALRVARALASWALCLGLVACSHTTPTPAVGVHADEQPLIVPYPPPPGKVEIVPPPPESTAVWVDGQWQWKGRRWVWQAGEWKIPAPGATYAPPLTERRADKTLAYFPGVWKPPKPNK